MNEGAPSSGSRQNTLNRLSSVKATPKNKYDRDYGEKTKKDDKYRETHVENFFELYREFDQDFHDEWTGASCQEDSTCSWNGPQTNSLIFLT